MSDVNVLYTVTAVVLAALAIWTGYVLVTAPDAPDESPPEPGSGGDPGDKRSPAERLLRRLDADEEAKITSKRAPDETPPPAIVDVAAPSERAIAIAGKSAPVVIMPVMRQRLDSHSEIRDDDAGGPAAVDEPPPESAPMSGPPLALTSAIGRSDAASGPTEMSAIVDRHRLFILGEGAGQRVQNELVSAVVVNALAAAFEADADGAIPKDATLPHRADRLRRATAAADAVLKARGEGTDLDLSRVGVLAAHFSPDNRHLYVTTAGAGRAYRLRAQSVTHINKPGLGGTTGGHPIETASFDVLPDDVYVFGSDAAFLALGDELRAVLTFDAAIDRVAAHFVAAATREAKSTGMTAIVVRVASPRPSAAPPA